MPSSLFSLLILLFNGFSAHAEFIELPANSSWLNPIKFQNVSTRAKSCETFPAELVCVTDRDITSNSKATVCDRQAPAHIIKTFSVAYLLLPEIIKREVCQLSAIYVHDNQSKDFPPGSYASANKINSIMGFNSNLFTEGTLSQFDSNKLLWLFGLGNKNPLGPVQDSDKLNLLQVYSGRLEDNFVTRLVYFLTHEAGHVVDFKYGAITFDCRARECRYAKNSFGEISWKTSLKFNTADSSDPTGNLLQMKIPYSYSSRVCFYRDCSNQKISPAEAQDFFSTANRLPFASIYALTDPEEDFAETWTDFHLSQAYDAQFTVRLHNQVVYSSRSNRSNPEYTKKLKFIEKLSNRINLEHDQKNKPAKQKST